MICVECGSAVNHVYRDYGKGNVRLTRCQICHEYADKYIEYEFMLVLLDLILHRHQVYRHLLFNRIDYHESGVDVTLLKLIPAFICFDAYLKWFRLAKYYDESFDSASLATVSSFSSKPYDYHFTLLGCAALEFLLFVLGILMIARLTQRKVDTHFVKYNYLVMAILISTFGRLLIVLMMIWDYDVNFGRVVNIFILTSNITATKVFLDGSGMQASACVLGGYMLRMLVPIAMYLANRSFIMFIL
uniref:Protein ARV n=1 Tax=Hirondellea gigas TaxID=1518452 RepID=A0A6A7G8X0_9CRUS